MHPFWCTQVLQDPSERDITSTCRAVQRSVAIVGPHGGALANAIFLRPGAHVLELGPPVGGGACARWVRVYSVG